MSRGEYGSTKTLYNFCFSVSYLFQNRYVLKISAISYGFWAHLNQDTPNLRVLEALSNNICHYTSLASRSFVKLYGSHGSNQQVSFQYVRHLEFHRK